MSTEIDPNDPFADDAFDNRKAYAESLVSVIKSFDQSTVVALSAPWGTGKSWFLERFKFMVTPCIYFSAWEDDYNDEPLAPLFAEIYNVLSVEVDELSKEELLSALGAIFKHVMYNLTKVQTLGILDPKKLETELENSLSHATRLIGQHNILKMAITDFKNTLQSAVEELPGQRLTIIVDELDRCRPSYAIEMLERIKHLFNIPGVTFILGIDKIQLSNSIRGAYGEGFDGLTYLERFFDHQFTFPNSTFNQIAVNKFGELTKGFDRKSHKYQVFEHWAIGTVFFSIFPAMTARRAERIVEWMTVIWRTYRGRFNTHELSFIATLCMMNMEDPEEFKKYTSSEKVYQDAIRWFVGATRPELPYQSAPALQDEMVFLLYRYKTNSTPAVNKTFYFSPPIDGKKDFSVDKPCVDRVMRAYEFNEPSMKFIVNIISLFSSH